MRIVRKGWLIFEAIKFAAIVPSANLLAKRNSKRNAEPKQTTLCFPDCLSLKPVRNVPPRSSSNKGPAPAEATLPHPAPEIPPLPK